MFSNTKGKRSKPREKVLGEHFSLASPAKSGENLRIESLAEQGSLLLASIRQDRASSTTLVSPTQYNTLPHQQINMGNKVSAAKNKECKKKFPDYSSNTPVSTEAQTSSAAAALHTGDNCEGSTANVNFKYEKGVCALSWWEPIRLLEEGSISDIHLVRHRKSFLKVRYKEKRNVMDLAKKQPNRDIVGDEESNGEKLRVLKSIHKDHIGDELVLEEMRREIHVMSRLNHPNIVRLIEAYERRRHIYLVLEYCSGGNLAQRVPMEEKNTTVVIRKVLSAVSYLHSMGLAHRDIKLENIMFDSTKEVKLIDFGLAAVFLADEYKADKVGTLYSMAPQ